MDTITAAPLIINNITAAGVGDLVFAAAEIVLVATVDATAVAADFVII